MLFRALVRLSIFHQTAVRRLNTFWGDTSLRLCARGALCLQFWLPIARVVLDYWPLDNTCIRTCNVCLLFDFYPLNL